MVVTPVPLCPSSSEAPGILPVFLLPQTSDYKSLQWDMLLPYPLDPVQTPSLWRAKSQESSSLPPHPCPSPAPVPMCSFRIVLEGPRGPVLSLAQQGRSLPGGVLEEMPYGLLTNTALEISQKNPRTQLPPQALWQAGAWSAFVQRF